MSSSFCKNCGYNAFQRQSERISTSPEDKRLAYVSILVYQGLPAGAAFGATLYRDFVLFGAAVCSVGNLSNSFILLPLFDLVQGGARWFLRGGKGLKVRRPWGSSPPLGTRKGFSHRIGERSQVRLFCFFEERPARDRLLCLHQK
jgi:hypothetical protein